MRLASSAGREGSGLGLAIVRSAAQRLGAELAIINTDPGLRVTLAFPQAQDRQPIGTDPPS